MMNWIQSLSKAIKHMEAHLTDEIDLDEIAGKASSSGSHFQFIFHVVMGLTVGEYIRNRRLTLAAQDLLKKGEKVLDVALRYGYDSPESFSRAFKRFHGVTPSKVQPGLVKQFHPLSINITIQGGFDMSRKLIDEFYWRDIEQKSGALTAEEKYQQLIDWARKARGQNPVVFDKLTAWVLDDEQWTDDKLPENEQILMQGVFARFREQNAKLRSHLQALAPSDTVNTAVFDALDRFDDELSGKTHAEALKEVVARVFADFTAMKDKNIRKKFAGGKTGATGTATVDFFGFINLLKDCDAAVQWALFMPQAVKQQQNGFKIESFEYRKMPALRFIGREFFKYDAADMSWELDIMRTLDAMTAYKSGFDYDLLFAHHYGKGVDVERWHGYWGRFMKEGTPVPENYVYFDFVPQHDGQAGAPFISQFAFATFSGDMVAMHKHEGYDCDAMYDITRNTMLGQGVLIPYPDKYWTAEVFLNGCATWSSGYLFSADGL
ncbi:MAG: AraC family transcriptional regulator [Bacillota bacterium]|nr:AraC family transcriptional regulator [Bacillota bacterium]